MIYNLTWFGKTSLTRHVPKEPKTFLCSMMPKGLQTGEKLYFLARTHTRRECNWENAPGLSLDLYDKENLFTVDCAGKLFTANDCS